LPEAAPLARAWTRELLCEWGLADLADDAETVAAELLANAIEETERAGLDTQIRLTLIGSSLRTLVITVWDGVADGPPVPGSGPGLITGLVVDDDAESGRGLLVAAAYSARLDWKHAPGGKVVRALLRGKRARR
jgi:anti-sigma regulatory factor (Ser/Thr protein kinase)